MINAVEPYAEKIHNEGVFQAGGRKISLSKANIVQSYQKQRCLVQMSLFCFGGTRFSHEVTRQLTVENDKI